MDNRVRIVLLMLWLALGAACLMSGFRQGLLLVLMAALIVELLSRLAQLESDWAEDSEELAEQRCLEKHR